jgi:hypothetical protein
MSPVGVVSAGLSFCATASVEPLAPSDRRAHNVFVKTLILAGNGREVVSYERYPICG